jgi:uncharacterized MnhB-related membrane protein
MQFTDFVFYILSAILLLASLRVITARNPVHAALALVLAFFTAAGLWLLLEAEFLAITLVLVYIGAVMVLFLFVVMMLDINLEELRTRLLELSAGGPSGGGPNGGGNGHGAGRQGPGPGAPPRPMAPTTATSRNWAACFTPTTSTPSNWPPCCCWWPWWRPSP